MGQILDIVDGVVDLLSAATMSMAFTAVRGYAPRYDLEDMHNLHVTVVPRDKTTVMATRSMAQHDIGIDVAVQKKIQSDSELPGLLTFVEEIDVALRGQRVLASASWVSSENVPIYSAEHLLELRQFTSILRVVYTVNQR